MRRSRFFFVPFRTAMTMPERDATAAEWQKTLRLDEVPSTAPKI